VKLEMKKKDIEQLLETEHKLWEEFRELASGDKFVDYLAKVYKKKIRRSKKKQPADRPSMSEGAFALCAWIRYARAARRGACTRGHVVQLRTRIFHAHVRCNRTH